MIWLDDYLKSTFGEKVYKISLTSFCTCPNRDGTKSFGGCAFCSQGGSGEFAQTGSLDEQFAKAKALISQKTNAKKYIAYYQSFSNTYGDVGALYNLFYNTIIKEEVVVLSIATRPDCINEEVLIMLQKLVEIKEVWVELGLQTVNEKTCKAMNMQYTVQDFQKAYEDLTRIGVKVIAHVIFGLPYEREEDYFATINYLSDLQPTLFGIKIQCLQVLKNTALSDMYEENPFPLLTLEEYGALLLDSIAKLPLNTVVHRITGDAPKKLLIEPQWVADKKKTINYLYKLLGRVKLSHFFNG